MKAEESGGAYTSLGTRQEGRRFKDVGLSVCLTNTSPRISEGRVLTISGRAEGQQRGQRD